MEKFEKIEFFFKDRIFFTNDGVVNSDYHSDDVGLETNYKSQILNDPIKYNIDTTPKLADKINPFIKYLKSKHMKKTTWYHYHFHLSVKFLYCDSINNTNDTNNLFIYDKFEMDEDDGRAINLREISVSTFPFQICINIHCTYYRSVVSEYTPEYEREYESFFLTKDEWRGIFYNGINPLRIFDEYHHPFFDSEDEQPDLPKPQKSFKTYTCVICLTKEPNILVTDCLHICICLDCEEIKPFSRCPSCRTRIETKVMT